MWFTCTGVGGVGASGPHWQVAESYADPTSYSINHLCDCCANPKDPITFHSSHFTGLVNLFNRLFMCWCNHNPCTEEEEKNLITLLPFLLHLVQKEKKISDKGSPICVDHILTWHYGIYWYPLNHDWLSQGDIKILTHESSFIYSQ